MSRRMFARVFRVALLAVVGFVGSNLFSNHTASARIIAGRIPCPTCSTTITSRHAPAMVTARWGRKCTSPPGQRRHWLGTPTLPISR